MIRRMIISITCCLAGGIAIVTALVLVSGQLRDMPGSFLRQFRSHPTTEMLTMDLNVDSYYIAGVTRSTVYFGNYLSPLHLLILDISSGDTTHIDMSVDGVYDQKFWSLRVEVDSPRFWVHDGAVPRIYKGEVKNWKARRWENDSEFFLDLEPIGRNSLIVKSLISESDESVIGKVTDQFPNYDFKADILHKQVDGFFCVDGYLQYDKATSNLVYLYRYRNEFIVVDTSLNVSWKGHTIDTNSVAKIEVATIQSSGARVFKSPPLIVNDRSSIFDNWLFVNSMLVSRNEPRDALQNASAIDVYDLTTNQYKFSFYLFDYEERERLREFRVLDDRLVALFATHVRVYELNKNYFWRD